MVFNLIVVLFIIIHLYGNPSVVSSPVRQRSPEELAGAFEGDIMLTTKTRGVAKRDATARWINNTVPYEISSAYTAAEKTIIENAMRKLEQLTAINNFPCVQFRPKTATDLSFITIIDDVGCYSYVGLITGWTKGQPVSLQRSGCLYEGTIMHELLHTLGFWHEQARPDRDSYVRVNYANIGAANIKDFEKKTVAEADTQNTAYDYASIMHYGPYYFSANGLPTIEPLQPNVQIGGRTSLSPIDIQEVRSYYNCSARGTTTTTTTTIKTTPTTTVLSSGRWATTGSLSIGRIHHTSSILSDGRVITIGGIADGSGVELYNSVTQIWSRGKSMNDSRMLPTATLLPDGRLFVAGGYYFNKEVKTAEIYNSTSNTWTSVGSMNFGRYGHQAIYLPSPWNKILVMGGYDANYAGLNSCELYDFATNKWTITTSMVNQRVYFTAIYLPSLGKVVVIGGSFGYPTAETYIVSTAQWISSANAMSDYRQASTATLIPAIGQILIVGSGENIKTTYLFNPTTNLFTFAANTTEARSEPSATLLPSGLVLVSGGMSGGSIIHRSAEVYDYRFNTWRAVADMSNARFRHNSILLNSSSSQSPVVLVISGQKESSTSTPTCELFFVNG